MVDRSCKEGTKFKDHIVDKSEKDPELGESVGSCDNRKVSIRPAMVGANAIVLDEMARHLSKQLDV